MYKLFVDDTGSKDYINPYDIEKSNNFPNWKKSSENRKWLENNFFGLCGIFLETKNIAKIDNEIKNLKKEYFGTEKVEIKSTFLRHPKNQKKHYFEKYNISSENLKDFGEKIYEILEKYKNDFQIFAVIFDKRKYRYRDKESANPLLQTTQILFERIEKTEKETIIVFDQMENSLQKIKGKNGEILKILQGKNKNIICYNENQNFSFIKDIEFQKSENENLLQIADIIAYNIRRQFMEFGDLMINGGKMQQYPYFEKISKNIFQKNGKYRGYGLVLCPDFNKIEWKF